MEGCTVFALARSCYITWHCGLAGPIKSMKSRWTGKSSGIRHEIVYVFRAFELEEKRIIRMQPKM